MPSIKENSLLTANWDAKVISSLALLFLSVIIVIALFRDTAGSIIQTWNSSETFAHGYIIVPISAWLIWGKRSELRSQAIKPCWPALPILLLCGAAWFIADVADVQVVRQYAFVAMLPTLVLVIAGSQVAKVIAFPLLFLLFAVPFGEVFIAPLVSFTADFTVHAIQLTGIPILRDGANFSLPSGNWSVLEACSGVRYLIASVTLGVLYAYLTYRSWRRRLVFVVLSVLVPIIANGFRAFSIVMIGHFSSMQLAVGVDHIIWGWMFFGLVMLIMYWIGSRWREDIDADDAEGLANTDTTAHEKAAPTQGVGSGAIVLIFIMAICSTAIWPLLAAQLRTGTADKQDIELSTFRPAWPASPQFSSWSPEFFPPSASLQRTVAAAGHQAQIDILYYKNPPRGKGMISSENRLLPGDHAGWQIGPTSVQIVSIANMALKVRQTTLNSARGQLLIWQLNWIGGTYVENNYLAKILQAKNKILTGSDDGAVLFLSTPITDTTEGANAILHTLLADHFSELNRVFNNNLAHGAR